MAENDDIALAAAYWYLNQNDENGETERRYDVGYDRLELSEYHR